MKTLCILWNWILRLRFFFMYYEAWFLFYSIDILSSYYSNIHIYGRKISIKSKYWNMTYFYDNPSCAFLKLLSVYTSSVKKKNQSSLILGKVRNNSSRKRNTKQTPTSQAKHTHIHKKHKRAINHALTR